MCVNKLSTILQFLLVLMSAMVSYAMADAAKDRDECAQQIVGLLHVCLTLVDKQKQIHQTVALVLNKSYRTTRSACVSSSEIVIS